MADIRTRTYKCNWYDTSNGGLILALSGFEEIDGDTASIGEVVSVSAKYYVSHETSDKVGYTTQLLVGSSETISSAKVYKKGKGTTHTISASFASVPNASYFNNNNITLKITPDSRHNDVRCIVDSSHPISITVTYYSNFIPFIKGVKLYRANSIGAASDSGLNLTFQATVGVNSLGSGGSGTLKLYDVTSGSRSLVFSQTGITGSTSGTSITKAPIYTSGTTRYEMGTSARYYVAEYSYTASMNGSTATESIESARIYISDVFTNVHLAGVSTGGVAFGRFSGSSQGNPRFECNYPTYLYGNIAHISDSPTSPKWRLLIPINGTTPGTYEGSPIGGGDLACRKIEDKRIITGSVLIKPPTEDQGTIVIADLAENGDDGFEWTPSCAVFSINACQGSRIARIVVGGRGETNAGKLCLSWVRNLSDGSIYSSAAIWVQCSIEYWWD